MHNYQVTTASSRSVAGVLAPATDRLEAGFFVIFMMRLTEYERQPELIAQFWITDADRLLLVLKFNEGTVLFLLHQQIGVLIVNHNGIIHILIVPALYAHTGDQSGQRNKFRPRRCLGAIDIEA